MKNLLLITALLITLVSCSEKQTFKAQLVDEPKATVLIDVFNDDLNHITQGDTVFVLAVQNSDHLVLCGKCSNTESMSKTIKRAVIQR